MDSIVVTGNMSIDRYVIYQGSWPSTKLHVYPQCQLRYVQASQQFATDGTSALALGLPGRRIDLDDRCCAPLRCIAGNLGKADKQLLACGLRYRGAVGSPLAGKPRARY